MVINRTPVAMFKAILDFLLHILLTHFFKEFQGNIIPSQCQYIWFNIQDKPSDCANDMLALGCRAMRQWNLAENLSLVRRLALTLLKQENTAKVRIMAKRLMAGWNEKYLLKVLRI